MARRLQRRVLWHFRYEGLIRDDFPGWDTSVKARTRTSIRNVRSLAPEHDYSGVLSGLPVGLYQSTPAGRILDANPAMVRMLGYPTRDALLAINAGDRYVNPEHRQRWQALIERERVLVDFETQYRRHDGTVIWVQDRARAMIADDGEAVYYARILFDITAREQAEEVLRQNGASFRLPFPGNPLPQREHEPATAPFLGVDAATSPHL